MEQLKNQKFAEYQEFSPLRSPMFASCSIATLPQTRAFENSLLGNDYDMKAIADAFADSPALDTICLTFDLSLFETTILLSCVGQAIDPGFPDLFAIAHNKLQGGKDRAVRSSKSC